MSDQLLKQVEFKLEQLIQYCARLENENTQLREEKEGWNLEKTRLMNKNSLARKRVEELISHLKTIETEP